MRLRTTLSLLLCALGVLGTTSSCALIVLSSWLDRASGRLDEAVESVSLAEEAIQALLLHPQARAREVRDALEGRMHRSLELADAFVTTPEEEAALGAARAWVVAYLDDARGEDEYDRTLGSLHAFVALNLEQAKLARADAVRWHRVGNTLGGSSAVAWLTLLLLTTGRLRRSLHEVLRLGEAMDRFGKGDRDARAPVAGPVELREMALHFNEMASALVRERDVQLAFLAGVAHDLRNPLAAIRTASYLLRSERPTGGEGAVPFVRESLARQVDHLDRMVGDLLESSRIDAGHLTLIEGEHDVRSLAREVVEMFTPVATDHRLTLHVPPDPAIGRCDATRIAQVLTNLVSNAIKYSPSGTGVDVTVGADGDAVSVTVHDEGVGIAGDELEAVFEPFRRGRSQGPAVAGAGLGLYVARKIVEAHGGHLEVQSEPGRGSSFVMRIPAAHAPAPA